MDENSFFFGTGDGQVFGEGPEEGAAFQSRDERILETAAKIYNGAFKFAQRVAPVVQKTVETVGPVASKAAEKLAPVVKNAVEKAKPVAQNVAVKAIPVVENAIEKATPVVINVMDKAADYIKSKMDGTITAEATETSDSDIDANAQRIMTELAKLDTLYAEGIISDEEYEKKKYELFE